MAGGAPFGNQNGKKAKQWEQALKKALARTGGSVEEGLARVADKLVAAAETGDQWAIKEIGDRIDGKAAQQVTVSGDPDAPLETSLTVTFK